MQSNALFSLLPNVLSSFYAVFFVLFVRGLITRGLEVKVFFEKNGACVWAGGRNGDEGGVWEDERFGFGDE